MLLKSLGLVTGLLRSLSMYVFTYLDKNSSKFMLTCGICMNLYTEFYLVHYEIFIEITSMVSLFIERMPLDIRKSYLADNDFYAR